MKKDEKNNRSAPARDVLGAWWRRLFSFGGERSTEGEAANAATNAKESTDKSVAATVVRASAFSAPSKNGGKESIRASLSARAALWPKPEPFSTAWSVVDLVHLREELLDAVDARSLPRKLEKILERLASRPMPRKFPSALEWIDAKSATPERGSVSFRSAWIGRPLLCLAAEEGKFEVMRVLLRFGANPNAVDVRHKSPLGAVFGWARRIDARNPDPEMLRELAESVEALLRAGANPDSLAKGIDGHQPVLWSAACSGFDEVVKQLLSSGARANLLNEEGAPLLCQLAGNSPKLVRFFEALKKAGAGLDAKDPDGKAPLHVAAEWGNAAAIRELLRLGADEATFDERGKTWRDIAKSPIAKERVSRLGISGAETRALAESLDLKEELAKELKETIAKESRQALRSESGLGDSAQPQPQSAMETPTKRPSRRL